MKTLPFDHMTRRLATGIGRRQLLQGALAFAVSGAALGRQQTAEAAVLCLKNGSRCTKKSSRCQAAFCLKTPFTITAHWTSTSDNDSFLFVPNDATHQNDGPYIDYNCGKADTNDGALYPFAFFNKDATGPGDEILTVRKLLSGRYEYWIELFNATTARPKGDLTVRVRNSNGTLIRSFSSPPTPANDRIDWHVFDVSGKTRSITAINEVIDALLPEGAHSPNQIVCPA
jgi:hypothetical protein